MEAKFVTLCQFNTQWCPLGAALLIYGKEDHENQFAEGKRKLNTNHKRDRKRESGVAYTYLC
jgi:hypothetical protein